MRSFVTLAAIFVSVTSVAFGEGNWPQWRGPSANGVATGTNLPTEWSTTKNIVWKTEMPSWSGGTPALWGDRIFVTSASKGEPQAPATPQQERSGRGGRGGYSGPSNPGGDELLLLCLAKPDGKILWERVVDKGNRLMRKQNSSSPSPVTDGEHVWVVTGTGAVAAYDMAGAEVWKRNLEADYGAFGLGWGYASSPLLHDKKLIIEVLHGRKTDDPSYLLALDAASGKEIWRQERPTDAIEESPDAYTTPALLEFDGKTEIVVTGGDYVTGNDPATGREIWRSGGLNPKNNPNFRIVASPVAVDGMIYAPTRVRPLLALRAGGEGDITTSHLAWSWTESYGPDVPTPICDGKYFYMVDDKGVITCLDAKTGAVVWGPEHTADGIVSSSPILADGKIYITNEKSVTSIVSAGATYALLGTNELDGSYTLSSPIVSGSQLFIRTATHLYCIQQGA